MKSHAKRVMGIAFEKKLGYVYSIGEDGKFKISDVNSHSVVSEMTPGKAGLKHMLYRPDRAIFIMGDGDGYIHIYNSIAVRPKIYN